MRILILGCGPAGLMAAQGANDAHADNFEGDMQVSILSRKAVSHIYGCQYLHAPIPRVTPPSPHEVSYQLRGDALDYRRKVYGQMWTGSVSPEDLAESHQAWDLRETYHRLWKFWEYSIQNTEVDPVGLQYLLQNDRPDLIINSIPRPALCSAGHSFAAQEVWAAGDAPELGIRIPFNCPDDMVICNGLDNPSWYRMSRVYGHMTVEWPGELGNVPVTTATRIKKPLDHNCDCWDGDMVHVGRYGEWSKGILSHSAYFKAYKVVDQMLGAGSGATA